MSCAGRVNLPFTNINSAASAGIETCLRTMHIKCAMDMSRETIYLLFLIVMFVLIIMGTLSGYRVMMRAAVDIRLVLYLTLYLMGFYMFYNAAD
jgi:hypothetical protein